MQNWRLPRSPACRRWANGNARERSRARRSHPSAAPCVRNPMTCWAWYRLTALPNKPRSMKAAWIVICCAVRSSSCAARSRSQALQSPLQASRNSWPRLTTCSGTARRSHRPNGSSLVCFVHSQKIHQVLGGTEMHEREIEETLSRLVKKHVRVERAASGQPDAIEEQCGCRIVIMGSNNHVIVSTHCQGPSKRAKIDRCT